MDRTGNDIGMRPIAIRPAWACAGRARGYALLLAAIILWGGNWPVMKAGLAHITPVWFSAVRFLAGALTLFALQASTGTLRRPRRGDLSVILSVGLLQMLAFTVLGAVAMTHVSAGRSAILAYTTPLWVIPIAMVAFREKLSRAQMAGSLVALAGVLMLFNPASFDWHDASLVRANLLLMLAAFCWAVCILHLRYGRAVSSAYQLAPWQMLVAALILVPLAYGLEGPFTADGTPAFWEIALYVGPIATAFCFVAVNAASGWLSSTTMSTAMLGVPVVGLVLATIVLREPVTAGLLGGLGAIVAGIAIVTTAGAPIRPGRYNAPAAEPETPPAAAPRRAPPNPPPAPRT